MQKYKTYLHYLIAKLYRDIDRRRVSKLISWSPLPQLEPGCTAIMGMCSKLPYLLGANLYCLDQCRWKNLKELIITVDTPKGSLPQGLEEEMISKYSHLKITFLYYTPYQAEFAAKVNHPHLYSWLSWSICLNQVRTQTVLIQDYDALVLSKDVLQRCYQTFVSSGAKIQGISWCQVGGLTKEDRLATTFEAFVDVQWLRSFPLIMGYNRVGTHKNRWVDYDIYLDIQANYTPEEHRTLVPMSTEELVHPSQMISQYMRLRYTPEKALPCSAVIMIPFFHFLSGQKKAFKIAIQAIEQSNSTKIDLLGKGIPMNFSVLDTKAVDFILKLMLRALIKLNIPPFKEVVDYGTALYKICKTPQEKIWKGDFTEEQRGWIADAREGEVMVGV